MPAAGGKIKSSAGVEGKGNTGILSSLVVSVIFSVCGSALLLLACFIPFLFHADVM